MKKLLLSAAALLVIAASIFGGYYYFVTNDLQETAVERDQSLEETEGMPDATDEGAPMRIRGGAWKDENGQIKQNGIADAVSQRENYLTGHMPPDGFGDKGDAASIPPPGVSNNWLPLGGQQNLSGRTEAIVFHPKFGSISTPINRGIMWAGGSTGGVWKSNSSGNLWYATNSMLGNFSVSCLALDPGDPTGKTLYAGTGQEDLFVYGGGVFKSTNGGETWERMARSYEKGWSVVNAISVTRAANNEVIILAAMANYNEDFTDTFVDRGVMRYTGNNNTWTKATDFFDPILQYDPVKASFVGFDPNNSERAVASTCYRGLPNYRPDGYCKAWYSTDRGLTWHPSQLERTTAQDPNCTPPFNGSFETCRYEDPIYFAYQKAAPGSTPMVYAQYRNAIGPSARTVLSKSVNAEDDQGPSNGGASFTTSGMTGFPDGIGTGTHAFWVSPQLTSTPNSVTIVTGGTSLYRSNNNGQTLDRLIANGYILAYDPVNPHLDMQTVVTDTTYPNNNKKAFVATDGGIFHTDDITAATGDTPGTTPSGWTIRNQGLLNTQYYDVAGAYDPSTGKEIVFGGLQDNASIRILKDADPKWFIGGDGATSEVSGNYCFGQEAFPYGHLLRIKNCGSTADEILRIAPQDVNPAPPINADFPAGHIPMVIDALDQNRAFLGVKSVWKTDNVKSAGLPIWTAVKSNAGFTASPTATSTGTPSGTPSATPTATPTAIIIRPEVTEMAVASDSNYMWVAENIAGEFGNLYRSTNALATGTATPTWTPVDNNGPSPLPKSRDNKDPH